MKHIRRRFWCSLPLTFVASVATYGCQAPSNATAQASDGPTAFVGATLVDGTGAAALPDAVIVVENGRVECVGGRGDCSTDGAEVLDATGRWIIPGLVDAHVHFSQTGWVDGRPDALDLRTDYPYERTAAWLHDNTEALFRSYLCNGVTSVFDVGGYPWTWDLQARTTASVTAPRVKAAGPLLSTRDFWLNLPGQQQFIHTSDEETVRTAVRTHAVWGAAAVKIWYILGAETVGARRDHLSAMVHAIGDETRGEGIPLIVHATGLWQAKDAVRAGAHLLVHSVTDQPVDDEFLELAREQGTFYNPTLVVSDGYLQVRARSFERRTQPLECVDPTTLGKIESTDEVPVPEGVADLATLRDRSARRVQTARENLMAVHRAGIPVVFGTDAGNPLTLHGSSVFIELEAMDEAGMTPMEVLVAATRNGARAMGLEDTGTIEEGMVADLVILRADPLADIRNVREIASVMRLGKLYDRSELTYR